MTEIHEVTDTDFSQWQQQSKVGTVVEFFFLIRKFFRSVVALIVYLFITIDWQHYIWIGVAFLISIALMMVFSFLAYKNTTFRIDEHTHEFILHKGIFNKTKVSIQLDKIIQVNINQNFIQKLVRVFSVEIETAGSVKSEAVLKAIDHDMAFRLKKELLSEKQSEKQIETHENTTSLSENIKSIHISFLQLFKYAFTADYFKSTFILIGIIISFISRLQEYAYNFQYLEDDEIENVALDFFDPFTVVISIIVLVFTAIFINATRSIIKYFQMEMKLSKDSTWITYGLFGRKNTVLQNNRTQKFTFSSNPLQRLLKVYKLRVSQISSDIDSDKKANINIVGIDQEQISDFFQHINHESYPENPYHRIRINVRMLVLPILILSVIPILVFISDAIFDYVDLKFFIIGLIFYIGISAFLLNRFWRKYSIEIYDNFIIKTAEMWTRKVQIIDIQKIQSVQTTQYFWQKRSHLGGLILQTAGGRITINYADYSELNLISNYLLYRIESI